MTVNEAIKELQKLSEEGLGDAKLIWQSISHTWDVEFKKKKRDNITIILVNP